MSGTNTLNINGIRTKRCTTWNNSHTVSDRLCWASPSTTDPHLFPSFLNDKEGVGPIRHSEGKSVCEGVAAVMAVADTVLVDVFHSEGGGEEETLPPGSSLDGAVAWGLHNAEGDRLSLPTGEKREASSECLVAGSWQRKQPKAIKYSLRFLYRYKEGSERYHLSPSIWLPS